MADKARVQGVVTSDRMEDCQGRLTWTVTDVAGQPLKTGTQAVAIPAHKSLKVETLKLADEIKQHGKNNVLVWLKLEVGGATVSDNLVTFVYPRALDLADPQLAVAVAEGNGTFTVTLTVDGLASVTVPMMVWTGCWVVLPSASMKIFFGSSTGAALSRVMLMLSLPSA